MTIQNHNIILKLYYFKKSFKLAKSHNGEFLSSEHDYQNSKSKLKWRCDNGHIWEAPYNKIQQGGWCPVCKKIKNRKIKNMKQIGRYQQFAKKKNGKCLSSEYINDSTKLVWQCDKGHQWKAIPYSIFVMGTWCPYCARNVAHNIGYLTEIAKFKGGKLLSTKYINIDTKYDWICSLGHTFSKTLNKVTHNQWCPYCSKSGISEEVCRVIFEDVFNEKFPRSHPLWLKTPNGFQMEIDGYSEKLKIGFEYQGRQHFEKSYYISSDLDLKKRQNYDLWKKELCKEKGIRLFTISYKTKFNNILDAVKEQANVLNINLPNQNLSSYTIQRAFIKQDRIEELKKICESKNGELLSSKWLGTNEKYKVRCKLDGHIWEALGNELLRGAWCKLCSVRVTNNKRKLDIDFINNFAKSNDGICLSKTYINSRTPYIFRCNKGHIFKRVYWNMRLRNQWCPFCSGNVIRTSNKVSASEIDNRN